MPEHEAFAAIAQAVYMARLKTESENNTKEENDHDDK